jgi:hypothetical protein
MGEVFYLGVSEPPLLGVGKISDVFDFVVP